MDFYRILYCRIADVVASNLSARGSTDLVDITEKYETVILLKGLFLRDNSLFSIIDMCYIIAMLRENQKFV
jgi:hypothetical protein